MIGTIQPVFYQVGGSILAAVIVGVFGYIGRNQAKENKRLRRKLRTALTEIEAFRALEDFYAKSIEEGTVIMMGQGKQANAIKRWYRIVLRSRGTEPPSDFSAPSRIRVSLAQLSD